jgi:hypothetical protein
MKKNPEKQAYYKALENAIIITLAPLEGLRKDTAAKLILGGVIGSTASEIAQELNMDYDTKKLGQDSKR